MSDPAGSGRRSSGGASNFYPNLLSEILSDMSDQSDTYFSSILLGDPNDSEGSGWSTPVSDEDDYFDPTYVDGATGEGNYVALFLQQIARWDFGG